MLVSGYQWLVFKLLKRNIESNRNSEIRHPNIKMHILIETVTCNFRKIL